MTQNFKILYTTWRQNLNVLLITLKSDGWAVGKCWNECLIIEKKYTYAWKGKLKLVPKFNNNGWMCEFSFIVDVTIHSIELNTRLQGKYQLIVCVWSHQGLWNIVTCLGIMADEQELVHFATLLKSSVGDCRQYVVILWRWREESLFIIQVNFHL